MAESVGAGIKAHIQTMRQKRHALAVQARSPQKRPSVMLGALASVYRPEMRAEGTGGAAPSSAAVWLDLAADEQSSPLGWPSGQGWLAGLSPAQAAMTTL